MKHSDNSKQHSQNKRTTHHAIYTQKAKTKNIPTQATQRNTPQTKTEQQHTQKTKTLQTRQHVT